MMNTGPAPKIRQALAGGPLTLHQLWSKTRIAKKDLLQALNNMARRQQARSLDAAPKPGKLSVLSDHDDRRWELTKDGAL